MASNPRTKGRMINKSISDSRGFASLTPESAVLFCMILPHLNSHGKMNGGPGFIKDEVCPRLSYITEKNIKNCLQEINAKTNIKWFEHEGRLWIHSVSFLEKHQALPMDKLGKDSLPSYSRVSPELLHHEVEVEVKEEVEVEERGDKSPPPSALFNLWNQIIKEPRATVMNNSREAKCRLRLKERSLDEWRVVLEKLKASAFCTGDNNRGWRADFDWIISNDTNALKVIEGKFDNKQGKATGGIPDGFAQSFLGSD
jgi:hypothetical protein